jgi:multiple sugar transport system permease protein
MYTKREKWWGYAFIAPQLLGMIVFSLLPLIFAFALSFMSWDGFGERTFVGLDNYIQQFQDPVFRTALRNTTLYSLLVIPGGIIAALGAALALNKSKAKIFTECCFLCLL